MTQDDLLKRIESLERDNRRMKTLGLVALVIVAALGAMYTASCSLTGRRAGTRGALDKVTAHEFDVLDPSGKVRVKIAMDCSTPKDCSPAIRLYRRNGKAATSVGAGVMAIWGEKGSTTLFDNFIQVEGTSRGGTLGDIANLGVGFIGPGAALTLSGKVGMGVELMAESALPGGEGGVLSLTGKNNNSVYLDADSPMIEIAEGKGSYMDLGSTALVARRTGATQQTSAASIVMFGNDKAHHVIWQAP